ncbi:hypothetical protein SNEBB_001413, partial [Seison nebaliae]
DKKNNQSIYEDSDELITISSAQTFEKCAEGFCNQEESLELVRSKERYQTIAYVMTLSTLFSIIILCFILFFVRRKKELTKADISAPYDVNEAPPTYSSVYNNSVGPRTVSLRRMGKRYIHSIIHPPIPLTTTVNIDGSSSTEFLEKPELNETITTILDESILNDKPRIHHNDMHIVYEDGKNSKNIYSTLTNEHDEHSSWYDVVDQPNAVPNQYTETRNIQQNETSSDSTEEKPNGIQ